MLCWNEVQSCFILAFLAVAAYSVSDAQGQVSPPTRLRYNVVNPDSVQISWKAPKGQFSGYKLLVTPSSGGKTNQLILQNTATKAIIQGLIPDQNYALQIIAFSDDKESKPAQGQFRSMYLLYLTSRADQPFSVIYETNKLILEATIEKQFLLFWKANWSHKLQLIQLQLEA